MKGNLLIIHGGGPTAVLNASLYGIIKQARDNGSSVEHIYGARNGTAGLLNRQLIDLGSMAEEKLRLLPVTPGSAIGTSRSPVEEVQYEEMTGILKQYHIRWVLCTGGNGTMDMCGRLSEACRKRRVDVCIMGVPKTMDNDLAQTDHSPGYGSAARFMAQSTRELCMDVRGLPIHVVILEALGRNAGWVTAASALAGEGGGPGPDLIYLPERAFSTKAFLQDMAVLLQKQQGVVAVVSEGLRSNSGQPLVPPLMEDGRAVYFGDVSAYLASLVIKELGFKARSEKPGLLGRASIALQSPVDCFEAQLAGETACRLVLSGERDKMVTLQRKKGSTYAVETGLTDIRSVMLSERTLPSDFIRADGKGVTNRFLDWCRPLLGVTLPQMPVWNEE